MLELLGFRELLKLAVGMGSVSFPGSLAVAFLSTRGISHLSVMYVAIGFLFMDSFSFILVCNMFGQGNF